MHKRKQHIYQNKPPSPWHHHLQPWASNLFIGGLIYLLIGIGSIATRLHTQQAAGAVGAILQLTSDIECILAGLTILIGGVLLLDYMERQVNRHVDTNNKI